jgi:hypothetical protein
MELIIGGESVEVNKDIYMNECISCSGTGRISCDCGTEKSPNLRCVTCSGEGSFKCPVCDGEGEF